MSNPILYESPPPLPQKSAYLTQLTIVAIVLLVSASVAWCWSAFDGAFRIPMMTGRMPIPTIMGQTPSMAQVVGYFVLDAAVVVLAPVIIFGATQMLRRKMYGFVRVAAILAMLPIGLHCCCVVGLPMGIWAMVLLNNPEVKAAFGVSANPS